MPARPNATATLGERPLASLLIYALDTRMHGTLVLGRSGSAHAIYFENGRPCQVHSGLRVVTLAQTLTDMDLITPAALAHVVSRCGSDTTLLGGELVTHGYISAGALAAARAEQMRQRVRALVALPPETRFELHLGGNLVPRGHERPVSPCDPLPLIVEAIRMRPTALPIVETIARLGDAVLSIHPDARIDALGLRLEAQVATALRDRPRTVQELIAARVATPTVTLVALYALAVTRCLRIHAGEMSARPIAGTRHESAKRHDSYPPPRCSGVYSRRASSRRELPRTGVPRIGR